MEKYFRCPFANMNRYDMARDPYTYPDNFLEAIRLIENAVAGEREDELFYNYLINSTNSQENKRIIEGIRNDEIKHNKLFRRIYKELTGKEVPAVSNEEFKRPSSFCDGIKRALFGELGAVERYRRILFAMQERSQINILTEIITDELRHANLYNFLYNSNKCNSI